MPPEFVLPDVVPPDPVEVDPAVAPEVVLVADDWVSLACTPQAVVTAKDAVMSAPPSTLRHRRRP